MNAVAEKERKTGFKATTFKYLSTMYIAGTLVPATAK